MARRLVSAAAAGNACKADGCQERSLPSSQSVVIKVLYPLWLEGSALPFTSHGDHDPAPGELWFLVLENHVRQFFFLSLCFRRHRIPTSNVPGPAWKFQYDSESNTYFLSSISLFLPL